MGTWRGELQKNRRHMLSSAPACFSKERTHYLFCQQWTPQQPARVARGRAVTFPDDDMRPRTRGAEPPPASTKNPCPTQRLSRKIWKTAAPMTESMFSAKPAVAAVVLGLMWLLEGLIPMFEGRRDRLRHGTANIALGLANATVVAFVFAAATLTVTEWARENSFGALRWLGLEGVAAAAAGLVLIDLWQYVWHRMNHRVAFLWRFHAVHHADRDLDASSGLRFHTGEIVLSSVARLAALPVLGASIVHVLLYEAILLPVILFHHANVRLPENVDRRLRWLVVTPRMHWVHHSRRRAETDSNYSSVLSLWDRLFGSFRLSRDPGALRLGLPGMRKREWATLPGMLAMPFRRRGPRVDPASKTSELNGKRAELEFRKPREPVVRRVRVFAPASVSNLACGFDVFGLALERPGDVVEARVADGEGVMSVSLGGGAARIPTEPKRNSAAIAAQAVLDRAGIRTGVALIVRKGVPLASGLGGSAASAVAGAVATDALVDARLSRQALLECALAGEEGGSGAAHADNVAPSLTGGFVLVLPGSSPHVASIPAPSSLAVAVARPHVEVETARARELLANAVPLCDGIRQWANTAGLVAGLYGKDWDLVGRCLQDAVAEPVRAPLVPGFEAVKSSALAAGALGAGLSGSGPSMFALCRGRAAAENAGDAMVLAFRREARVDADMVVSSVDAGGARVLDARGRKADSNRLGEQAGRPSRNGRGRTCG